MSYAVMPITDWQNIVDAVRAKTGKENTLVSSQVPAEINSITGGGGSLDGFHMVRFYNDDRTTLLYTVYVADGSGAIYAGDTPISTIDAGYLFSGFEPAAVNITSDFDSYAVYEHFDSLENATWEQISNLSAKGTAENFFAVGDTKTIHIEGTIVSTAINADYKVYIIGFNHNSELEGEGITFGTFKDSNGKDICFIQNYASTSGFSMNSTASNNGGWMNSSMRYSVLGSVDVKNAREAGVITATSPVENSLMAALPENLRLVMKPMTIYTDNIGGTSGVADNITPTIDYLPLLAEYEILGTRVMASHHERKKQNVYAYYALGNSNTKYNHSQTSTSVVWWTRSPVNANSARFARVLNETCSQADANFSYGIAPIFRV